MIRARLRWVAFPGVLLAAALAATMAAGPARAQSGEAAVLKRPAPLRDVPAETARSLASLAAQEPVLRIGDRQGLWVQVQTRSGATGWVHLFDLAAAPAGAAGAASAPVPADASGGSAVTGGLRGLTNLMRGGSAPPPRLATATYGIRGLEAEDIARAQPDLNAVRRMEQLRQTDPGARQFAASAVLTAVDVPPLPEPTRGRAPQDGSPGAQP